MKYLNKLTISIIILIGIIIFAFGINRVLEVKKARATFEDYYAFRGCTELLQKGQDSALCKTSASQTIKIVKFQGKWYLDGDLPVCTFNICF